MFVIAGAVRRARDIGHRSTNFRVAVYCVANLDRGRKHACKVIDCNLEGIGCCAQRKYRRAYEIECRWVWLCRWFISINAQIVDSPVPVILACVMEGDSGVGASACPCIDAESAVIIEVFGSSVGYRSIPCCSAITADVDYGLASTVGIKIIIFVENNND